MKTYLPSFKTLSAVFFLMFIFFANESFAQVTALQSWTRVCHNNFTFSQTFSFPISTGTNSNRILVVAIASSQTAVGARAVAITYGGQTMTLAAGNMGTTTTRQHTAIYYLKESGLDAASNSTLDFTVSGGTTLITTIWAAVFDNVNQTTPTTNTQNYNSITTAVDPFVFGTPLTINSGDQAILVISSVREGNTTPRSFNYPVNFTQSDQQAWTITDGVRNAIAKRIVPVTNTSSTCTIDLSGGGTEGTLASMTGVSLKRCSATVNAGAALSAICQGGTSATLGGSVEGSATGGIWSSSAGGTFTPNATTLNAIWTPPASYSGTATLTLSSSGPTCGIATASKTIVVRPRPTSVTANTSTSSICTGGTIDLTSDASSNSSLAAVLLNENFNATPVGWTTTNESTGGIPANAAWTLRPNNYNIANTSTILSSNDTTQFYLTDSNAQGSGGAVTAITATKLQSPAFSTVGLSAANLSFWHTYRYYEEGIVETAKVQISTDGTSWTDLVVYSTIGQVAPGGGFVQANFDLSSYLNQATVYIRFKYDASWDWYWAIDNLSVTGTYISPPPATFAWSSTPSGYTASAQNPTGIFPNTSTSYTVVATNSYGCTASATTSFVTVNPRSTASVISGTAAVCSGSPTNLSVAITGGASPFDVVYTNGSSNFMVNGYTSGSGIPISPLATTTYTLVSVTSTNGCAGFGNSGSAAVTIESTTSTNGGPWSNGSPTASKSAVFDNTNVTLGADFTACSLTLKNSSVVIISSGADIILTGALDIEPGSTFTLDNNANLLQTIPAGMTYANAGNIIVKRSSSALKRLDYTLWSSPVTGQGVYSFSPFTFANRFYVYRTATNVYNNADVGFNITGLNPDGVNGTDSNNVQFASAKGYLIRMPWDHPTAATVWNGTFTGVPNNGDIPFTMTNGGAGQRFNVVGNPYPSPINMTQFVSDNSANITGTLYFWRETNGTSANNAYCSWAGGTFTTNSEAQVFNPNSTIRTGQGFVVEALNASTSLVFKNGQRSSDNANQFFRNGNTTNDVVETNRFWLNLSNTSGAFSQMAAGYMADATNGVDVYDGKNINTGNVLLNSILDTTDYTIQGKALPFNATDVIPLSCKITTAGQYTIAIDHVDGLFTDGSQAIYLKDNVTNTEHNLQTGAYDFTSDAGTFTNRFEVVYQTQLGIENPTFTANNVIIYNQNNDFVVNSGNIIMSCIKIFDIRGRLLQEKSGINASQTTINSGLANGVLLVQITSEDGAVVTKKVIR
jgi:hypothetical protein